jgi:hypothetical protein
MSRLTLRLPETLHCRLVQLAEGEGVSLNQYITYALTRQVSFASPTQQNLTPTEKAEQFRQWIASFPKSDVGIPAEALHRESIYDDRGV